MSQPTKIPRAFASSGDKNTIPDSTGSIGLASWSEGFPAITSTPFAQGGVAPKRADFNGIFNALSAATVWQQQGGVYAYDNVTDYEVGNLVEDSGDIYQCMVANGPNSTIKSPSDQTVWSKLMNVTDVNSVLSSYLPLAGGTITGAIAQSNNNTATIRNVGTSGRVTIGGGTAYNTGAYLWLYGKDNSGGSFDLDANDGNTYSRLHGGADGTFWWGKPSNYKNIAMREDGVLANMFFSQTSGTYTAPNTGVYKITLKGGGGGGGGAQTTTGKCSGGGGEGAKNTIYANLVKNTVYSYVIGAGGSAGVSSANYSDVTGGSSGGTTSITISGTTYTALGGGGGFHSQTSGRGGMGGGVSTGGYCEPGANGTRGLSSESYGFGRASGGGHGGYGNEPALYGGGGSGGFSTNAATNGAAGYILIEYAG